MKLCFALLGFSVLLVSSARSGENPSMYLTGNPTVDFFGAQITPDMITQPHEMAVDDFTSVSGGVRSGKSPWLAGVMSFAIPGAGQAYANDYTKSVIFVAAEVASWAIHLSYAKKGDDQEVLFKAYANQHYSVVRYVNWTLDHLNSLTNGNTPNNQNAAYYSQQIYGAAGPPQNPNAVPPPFSDVSWDALNGMEVDIANSGVESGYSHQLPAYNEQQYYELIGKYDQFSRGWDDSGTLTNPDNGLPIQSTSQRFYIYAAMRAQANDYYDIASTFASVIVINHIVSALDAYWSATRYNSALHASININLEPTPAGFVPVTQANVQYDF